MHPLTKALTAHARGALGGFDLKLNSLMLLQAQMAWNWPTRYAKYVTVLQELSIS